MQTFKAENKYLFIDRQNFIKNIIRFFFYLFLISVFKLLILDFSFKLYFLRNLNLLNLRFLLKIL